MKILLDYLFPITAIEPTAAASTAFLKQVCVVANPKDGGVTVGEITLCTTMAQVNALVGTNAALEIAQLFAGGLSRVYVLPMDDLNLEDALEGHESDFYTILISHADFTDAEITASQATGTVTISSYANLLTTTPDTVTVAGVVFTAQSGAATLGTATFRAATSNDATAASLAAQINGHATAGALVVATVNSAVVTVTAIAAGSGGNALTLAYADVGTAGIGASVSGATLTGGDGLFLGAFDGVTGIASTDDTFLATHAAISNRCAFHIASANLGKNMFFAFGKLLSNSLAWRNQQYIPMPFADDVDTLGAANSLFDSRISFVISDSEFSTRLSMFCCGGKAIVAPYISKNLQIDLQSKALQYISGNQPGYTKTAAALLEDELQKVITEGYIDTKQIEAGVVEVSLVQDNFVASGDINIAEPKALWRIFAEMRQTL